MTYHPATAALLRWFNHDHLPADLQVTVVPFWDLATDLADHLPDGGPELTVALRKLLEAKDAAVRATIVNREAINARAAGGAR